MSTQTLTVVNVGGGWQNIVTFDEITYQHSADTTVSFCQADVG